MYNFGINPLNFGQQFDDIQAQISNIKLHNQECNFNTCSSQPIIFESNFGHSNCCQSNSWVPPKCDDPLINLILNIKYQMCNKNGIVNNCINGGLEESICIMFADDVNILIECSNCLELECDIVPNTIPCNNNVIVRVNNHLACKQKKIVYDLGLILRAIGLTSTRENINHLLDFLEDLAKNSMYFGIQVAALVCELKDLVASI
jgi:hypothetical protein